MKKHSEDINVVEQQQQQQQQQQCVAECGGQQPATALRTCQVSAAAVVELLCSGVNSISQLSGGAQHGDMTTTMMIASD